MTDKRDVVLPRRTSGNELTRLMEARGRGRELNQIRTLDFGPHDFDGTLTAAYEFGLLNKSGSTLTYLGREFVLAKEDHRLEILLSAMLRFEAYELLLEAIFTRGVQKETELSWIQTWWGTHGFGNSQTNREEGAISLARFCTFVRVGEYIIGRKGKNTRIEWSPDVLSRLEAARHRPLPGVMITSENQEAPDVNDSDNNTQPQEDLQSTANLVPSPTHPQAQTVGSESPENSTLRLNLGSGKVVTISLPPKVTEAEKQRLISLMEFMVVVSED